jgi:hypothetical protein
MKLRIFFSGLLFLTLAAFHLTWGRGENNPRAVGMGGAYTALARDLDAPDWNPANLGLSDGKGFTMNFLNLGMRLKNNSFSLDDYNRYNGKFLTDSDKDEIINSIPSTGLGLDLAAEASAFNFSIGNFAATYKGVGVTSFSVDRDPFRLMLLGNAVVHEVSVSDTRGEAFALGDAALSYGQAIKRWQGGELSVGASVHYLKGIAYGGITEARGGVVTTDTGFVGSGQMNYHTSRGGDGYSSDLGLAVRFSDDWFFSAGWQNVSSKINWRKDNKEYLMWFEMKPLTAESMLDENRADSLVSSNDTSYSYGSFSTRLTPSIRLGLAKKWKKLAWAFDWEQNLFSGPGTGVNPRIASGLEYKLWRHLPLRTGLAFGGNQGSIYSAGFGFIFGAYNLDLGLANSGSPSPKHTKGIRLAFGMSLRF